MADITENLKNITPRTITLAAVTLMVVSGLVVFALWSGGTDYQVLFSGLSPEDSGAVIEKLQERNIPYKVDGTAISVPSEKVYETRMELASEGVPQGGGVGFEIFDQSSFGVTKFVQKVNYKRALQGELSRTVAQIKEIKSARVHLAVPEKGVFLEEDSEDAKASVVVQLVPGASLRQEQVSAIVHLVANSHENLVPENVTVVDTTGKMWTNGDGEDGLMQMSSAQLEYKKSIEKDLETRVQTMLEKAVGEGNAVVRVSADIDTRHIERTEEVYDPDSQVVRSEQRSREESSGGSMAGVPGVASNLPGGTEPAASPAALETQTQNEVINYEINKVVSRVVEPVGAIQRLTVAVLVDGTYTGGGEGAEGEAARQFVPRSEEEIEKFTQMVKSAVGFSEDRGDTVTVDSAPFKEDFVQTVPAEMEAPSLLSPALLSSIIRYATVAFVSIFAILFLVRPLVKRLTSEVASPGGGKSLPEGGGQGGALPEGKDASEITLDQKLPAPDTTAFEMMKAMAKENPQQVAMVVKGWLKE